MANSDVYKLNTSRYGAHRIIASLIGEEKTVLDVGCNRGYLATLAPRNKYFGIDSNSEALKEAEKLGYTTELIDLDRVEGGLVCKEKVEFIVFADVLEHLKNPEEVGRRIVQQCLEDNGTVIVSLPNVAHFSTRLNLLLGKFDYTEAGTLDRTHLHLYTVRSAHKLVQDMGLTTTKILFSSNRFGALTANIPMLGTLLGFNIILICKKL